MAPILDLRPDELVEAIEFDLVEDMIPGIRVSIYEEPHPQRQYAIGADFALGMVGRDKDAFCVMDYTNGELVQVAEVEATLGEVSDKLLYGLAMYYGGAFILGERQFGLPSLRRLLNDFGYGWLYYERDEAKKHRPLTDKLGYFKRGNWTTDPALRSLRIAIRQGDIEIRSHNLIDQLSKLQFKPRTSIDPEDATDQDMQVKLAGGGSPDLVMALAYALHACREVEHFPAPAPVYAHGTAGDILDHADVFDGGIEDSYRTGTPLRKRARQIGRIGV